MFQDPQGPPEAGEVEVLVAVIESHESKHHAIGSADSVDAIKFRTEQQGLQPKDLERAFHRVWREGSKGVQVHRMRALTHDPLCRLKVGEFVPHLEE